MDLKEIKTIIELMKRNELALFELEREGFKIKLQRSFAAPGGYEVSATSVPALPAALAALPPGPAGVAATKPPASAGAMPTAADAAESLREITSPMVGTFYGAPSPESAAFVRVGQEVNEDTVVCIIEAMKVMNEIKAETRGTVAEIVAENGKPVQFGQALFRLR